jgi:serine O-acetyltransferase
MSQQCYLKYDLYRYFYPTDAISSLSLMAKLKLILLTQGIWALIVYRAGSWVLRNKGRIGLLSRPVLLMLSICGKVVEITTGISLPFAAKIGKGFYIGHFGQIIVSPSAVIGECCNISQGVTIGEGGRGEKQYVPIIGDRVYLAPGAKLFGNIRIGNDVAIGANAVVTKDLPDNAVAAGVPARVINFDSSRDFVNFNSGKMAES